MVNQSLTSERLASEWKQLQSCLAPHSFQFYELGTDSAYVMMKVKTDRGHTYDLRVKLREFPAKAPDVYVEDLILDKTGEDASPSSASLPTGYAKDRTQIDLYPQGLWSPEITLLDVYHKTLDWLQRYEALSDRSFVDE